MGGPKARKPVQTQRIITQTVTKPLELHTLPEKQHAYTVQIQTDVERPRDDTDTVDHRPKKEREKPVRNGHVANSSARQEHLGHPYSGKLAQNGYKKMTDEKPKHFGIYGKDLREYDSETETMDFSDNNRSAREHSPVWSKIRKGRPLVDYVDSNVRRKPLAHSVLNQQL